MDEVRCSCNTFNNNRYFSAYFVVINFLDRITQRSYQWIPSDIMEKTWQRIGGMNPEEMPPLINIMKEQQPLILAYLMAVDHDVLNQDERELLLYLGVVVWQIMSQGSKQLPQLQSRL